MAPAATFGVYAIQASMHGSSFLDIAKAFTSLALITLVSYPATRLLAAVPNLAASVGCFDRITEYLVAVSRADQRICPADASDIPDTGKHLSRDQLSIITPVMEGNMAICLDNASIRPAPGANILLRNVDLSIKKGGILMITGPVGVGKTTFLKLILGELSCDEGRLCVVSKHIAYCSQSPWLRNGTIRQAVCGTEEDKVDETWFETVMDACAMNHDISRFRAGNRTVIGSRGSTLSGGQKQRVALARALYSRAKIFLLDDVLSALDKETEKSVTVRLFGDRGLFHQLGATVIMVTHSSMWRHPPLL